MKSPLSYQISEYDCGPISLINAINYLFDREKLQPDLIKNIYEYTLDRYNKKGIQGMYGTSDDSMLFMSQHLNHYGKQIGLSIFCETLVKEEVCFNDNEHINKCIKNKGVVLFKCWLGCPHYVLLTDIKGDDFYVFDPYYRKRKFDNPDIQIIDEPLKANRIIKRKVFDSVLNTDYTLSKVEDRIAILMYNTLCLNKNTRRNSR